MKPKKYPHFSFCPSALQTAMANSELFIAFMIMDLFDRLCNDNVEHGECSTALLAVTNVSREKTAYKRALEFVRREDFMVTLEKEKDYLEFQKNRVLKSLPLSKQHEHIFGNRGDLTPCWTYIMALSDEAKRNNAFITIKMRMKREANLKKEKEEALKRLEQENSERMSSITLWQEEVRKQNEITLSEFYEKHGRNYSTATDSNVKKYGKGEAVPFAGFTEEEKAFFLSKQKEEEEKGKDVLKKKK